jgi:hypothetical protein
MGFVKPDSALVRVAEVVLAHHSAVEDDGLCGSCGQTTPCPPARHANEVRLAAGLTGPVSNERPFPDLGTVPRIALNKPARFEPIAAEPPSIS